MKLCGQCKLEKSRIEFSRNKTKSDGLQHECKSCSKLRRIEWIQRNPLKYKQQCDRHNIRRKPTTSKYYRQRYVEDKKYRARRLFILARERARKHDVPFDLSLEWVLEKLQQGICEVTHIPFVFEVKHSIFAPSIDRRVSSLGYTSDNCRLVIFGYNAAKGAGSDEEVRQMAAAIIHRSTP